MVKTQSLSHLVLDRYRVATDKIQTDRQTDRIAIANMRYSSTSCRTQKPSCLYVIR